MTHNYLQNGDAIFGDWNVQVGRDSAGSSIDFMRSADALVVTSRLPKGPEDVKKSVRAADELP